MNVIAVDAMGGDHAPAPEVAGAIAAVRETDVRVLLCGRRDRLVEALAEAGGAPGERIEIRDADEVVTMDDHPGRAYRQKRNSSLRVAFDAVQGGDAQAVVSAGNSGAVLSHALFVLKRLPEVERPGIVTVFPGLVLCDMGANVDVKPTMLAQFGVLGAHYDRIVHGHKRPRVGVLSNGTEDSKGNELTRAAHAILTRAAATDGAGFDYVGYVEGSELFRGGLDVVATDGFTGNIVLKVSEGVSQLVLGMVKDALGSSLRAKLGAALAMPALRDLKERISYSETGGALLAGVDGTCIICHGKSDGTAIKNAIKAANRFVDIGLRDQLAEAMARHRSLWHQDPEQPDDDRAQHSQPQVHGDPT